ncbi:hypothetical protein [Lactococcus lactis]|nr:hypothetical protein [Lactococcus lactis]
MDIANKAFFAETNRQPFTTDKLSVEKLQEELESCIQTLIEASVAANITQDIVVGNLVDRKLADLAKTHKLAVDYIEKVTGKNIDVVLAENAAPFPSMVVIFRKDNQ